MGASRGRIAFGDEIDLAFEQAVRQAVNFALEPRDAFRVYDVAGIQARREGRLSEVGPWTLLLSGAIGWASFKDLNGVLDRLEELSQLLRSVPPNRDLHLMSEEERESVTTFCAFEAPSVRAAKVTKVGALYRPRAIPILDSRVAAAYGYRNLGGHHGVQKEVVERLANDIGDQEALLIEAKLAAQRWVIDYRDVSLLRFADILIWTTMAGGWDQPLGAPSEPRYLGATIRTHSLLVPAHRASREEADTGGWAGRYEVAVETSVVLHRRPERPVPDTFFQETEPVSLWFEGRRYTWFPGDRDHHTVVTVPFADRDDYQAERDAMERFLSVLCFRAGHAIRVVLATASGFKHEFDAPFLWQPRRMRTDTPVPRELLLHGEAQLELALGLYREGMSATSPALRVLGFWKVVEVALNVTDKKSEFREWVIGAIEGIGDAWPIFDDETEKTPQGWFKWLRESRNAASHGLRDWGAGALTNDPHNPDIRQRLGRDADCLRLLARRAIDERWPKAVTGGAGP